jgi:nitrate/TMAO reductase-like tetraheme cytochrome c subunit
MKGRSILAVLLLVLLVAIGGFVVWGVRYTNSPNFCKSCHIIEPYVEAWQKSYMGGKLGVTCIDCHFEPGVLGYVRGKIYSLMKLTEYGTRDFDRPPPSADLLTNSACLQCHGNEPNLKVPGGHNVVDPNSPTYPKIAVVDQYNPSNTIMFPHDFHVNKVQIKCSDCHSAVVHGTELIKDKPQAKASPEFCSSCHSGDIAPILFGTIKPSGREHPGAPKIDTAVWRNNHWRLANGPGEINGVQYDKIEKQTCLACHKEPTEAKNCKSCHFHSEPVFSPTQETQRASAAPLGMFGLVIGIFLVTLVPYPKVKRFIFEGWIAAILAAVVLATDVYAAYKVFAVVLDTTSGSRQIGPVTLWIAYLLASASLLTFLFHQGVLKPRRRRLSGND